jgi:hypothetical protein
MIEFMTDSLDKFKDVDLEQLMFDDLVRQIREEHNERLTHIIIHPGVYKVIEDYKNQNTLQGFLQNLKWGFDECYKNFRNWQGHMNGEDWDFWEILSGEESFYD